MASRPFISTGGNDSAALPQLSPEAFGAGIGRAIGDVGEAIDRKKKLAEATQAAVAFAEYRTATDSASQQARDEADRYGSGHVVRVQGDLDQRGQAFLDGIQSNELRQQYRARIADYHSGVIGREDGFARKAQDEAFVSDADGLINLQSNRARTGTPESWGEEKDLFDGWLESAPLSEPVKAALRKDAHARLDRAFLEGRAPDVRLALIQSGQFNDTLDPRTIDTLTGEAGVEIRAAQAQVQAAARAEKAEARQTYQLFKQQVDAGMTFEGKAFEDMQALLTKHDMKTEIFDLGTAAVANAYGRISVSWTPEQWTGEANRLRAKIGKDPTKADPRDVVALDWVEKNMKERIKEAQDDPLAWAARQGRVIAPLDWAQPATLDQRKTAVRAAASQTGGPPTTYLQPVEAEEVRQLMKQGRQGKAEGFNRIAAWGDAAVHVARQVAPNDTKLIHQLTLSPYTRNLIWDGEEVLAGNVVTATPERTAKAFQSVVKAGPGGSLLRAAELEGVTHGARSIAAKLAQQSGLKEPSEAMWKSALHLAMGGEGPDPKHGGLRGGVGEWRGKPMRLASGVSQRGFDLALSRLNSNYGDGPKPVWSGKVVDMNTIRTTMTPVWVGRGSYQFVNAAGNTLFSDTGEPFSINIYDAIP